jgi:hypothetical protein
MARSRKKTVIAEGEISNKENSGSSSRCVWTDEDDAILVAVLAKQKQLGNSSDNGFKKSVWATVTVVQLRLHLLHRARKTILPRSRTNVKIIGAM